MVVKMSFSKQDGLNFLTDWKDLEGRVKMPRDFLIRFFDDEGKFLTQLVSQKGLPIR